MIERVRDTISDLENELEEAAEAYEELKEKHHMLTSSDAEQVRKFYSLLNLSKTSKSESRD